MVSSVSGHNLPLLLRYLQTVEAPARPPPAAAAHAHTDELEVRIEDVFTVPGPYWRRCGGEVAVPGWVLTTAVCAIDFGTVVAGQVVRSTVAEGAAVRLGPDADGDFVHTIVTSIRRSCVAVASASAGQHVTLALRDVPAMAVRRGMVLVQRPDRARVVQRFEATVEAVSAPVDALRVNSVGMLHVGAVRQAAVVAADVIPPVGGRARATFSLARHPEYLAVGDRFLFRCSQGFVKGQVSALVPRDAERASTRVSEPGRKLSPPRHGPPLAQLS
jgi:hypothetical protein